MLGLMLAPAAVEPFGFFTWDSLRAGWYLTWRLLLRVSPVLVVGGVAVAVFGLNSPMAGFLFSLGVLAATVWSLTLIPRLTSQWAQERYGQALEGALAVWWGITWRSMVVSLVAAAIMAVPSVVAVSLRTAYPSSALGLLGSLLAWLLNLVNIAVTVLATGGATSLVAASHVGVGAGGDGVARARSLVGEIEHPARHDRAAIVDSHLDGAVVVQVDHAQPRPERQRAMSRRERVDVEALAAGRQASVVGAPVPGRTADEQGEPGWGRRRRYCLARGW